MSHIQVGDHIEKDRFSQGPQKADNAAHIAQQRLSDLIASLEVATCPDRKLDEAIGKLCGRFIPLRDIHNIVMQPEWFGGYAASAYYLPFFTANVDAALTLMPDDHDYCINRIDGIYTASVGPTGTFVTTQDERGATPAIALCIATLKMRNSLRESSNREVSPSAVLSEQNRAELKL